MKMVKSCQLLCILLIVVTPGTASSADDNDFAGSNYTSDAVVDMKPDAELDEEDCIPQWGDCVTSDKPCCQRRSKPCGRPFPAEVLCFRFGDGVCKFRGHIRNADVYIRLSRQLNRTNFQALATQYWKSVEARHYTGM